MPNGTFQAEAASNSEKIKPIALAVIGLCLLKASDSQAVNQKKILLNDF